MTNHKKGDTIIELDSSVVVCISESSVDDGDWPHELPCYEAQATTSSAFESEFPMSDAVITMMQELRKSQRKDSLLVSRAVALIGLQLMHESLIKNRWIQRAQEMFGGKVDKDTRDHLQEWENLKDSVHAWEAIKEFCSSQNWFILLACVAQHVAIFSREHPLIQYAKTVIPLLTEDERSKVIEKLNMKPCKSAVGLSRDIQDTYSSQLFVVLLEPVESAQFPHSCIPNVGIQAENHKSMLSVSALYNLTGNMGLFRIEDTDAEERERQILLLTGGSCACLRCRYELDKDIKNELSLDDLLRLGRFYLGSSQIDEAEELFLAIKTKDASVLDSWHALGAIQLSRNMFLAAQRIWKEAKEQANGSKHEGLNLQFVKLDAYKYLSQTHNKKEIAACPDDSFEKVVQHVFRSPILDPEMCKQIITWVEKDAKWTKQRHYAVPTLDVPVHTAQTILEWFNPWFHEKVCPLLASQFKTSANYFVHDAFVVKYEACVVSNHLPIHTDESTHSFVLALNDEYTGGGTFLQEHDSVIRLKTGEILSFRGDLVPHGGEAVTTGKRYILAVFLYHDDDDDDEDNKDKDSDKKDESSQAVEEQGKKRPFHEVANLEQANGFSFGFNVGASASPGVEINSVEANNEQQ